ncbi:3-mercaptopyruvate sulfurtransferase [Brevundimonas sp. VNH65]|uniref:3-mercaptopyruvate sulfurtransferase n=1 Tax=Brevundimonas sp. VNH65 TaxID=3400917 RepID=UPI003C0FC363
MTSPLISTEDLQARLGTEGLKILDGSWHLDGRDAGADFDRERLPGAVRFDLDAVSDQNNSLPHMLPSAADFAASVGRLGIAATDDIVVYDTAGLFSAARIWWMFRVMGAGSVRVLDGGLPKWKAEGRLLETGAPRRLPAMEFEADVAPEGVAGLEDVRVALAAEAQVLDARGAARFRGEVAEPRPGLRSGHMPGAINLPYSRLIAADGTLLRGQALVQAFTEAGVDLTRPVLTTCGSGVTAAILSLGLAELGIESRLYDGSWAEWGGRVDTAVVTGA